MGGGWIVLDRKILQWGTRPKEYQDRLELIRKRRDEGRRKWEEEHEDE